MQIAPRNTSDYFWQSVLAVFAMLAAVLGTSIAIDAQVNGESLIEATRAFFRLASGY